MKGMRKSLYSLSIVIAFSLTLMALLPAVSLAEESSPAGAGTAGVTYTPNPRAVSLYNLGLTAHKQGSPESAIIFFKRACDIDPNLADAQYNLGVLYQMQKRYKEAIPRFEEVLRLKPTDPDAQFQLGCILQDSGRLQEARLHLSAIAPNSSHFSEAQRRIGQLSNLPMQSTAVDPNVSGGQAAQPLQSSAALRDPAATNLYQDLAGTSGAAAGYGQMSAQTMVQQQAPMQQLAQQSIQQQPATAYIPNGSTTAPPSPGGPVPVLANLSLRVIATGFSAPSGLAFDHNGSLYVANYMTNSIDRIGPDGSRNTFCTGVNLRGPIGLVVDDANNLYVANYNGGTVAKVNPAGISTVIASGFKKPYYLTLDKDGNLYVSQQEDNSIVRIVLPRSPGAHAQ